MPSLDSLAFLAVVLVALGALYTLNHASFGPSTLAIVGIPSRLGNTIVIAGLNLNEAVGADVSALTGLHLASLDDGVSSSLEGTTQYRQTLRFAQTGSDAFSSGTIRFGQDDVGSVGDFLVFTYGSPVFEYEIVFDHGLTAVAENGRLPGLEDASLAFMGEPATIYKASITGNALELRLFTSAGDMQIRDSDVTDSAFERSVKINGRSVNSQVRIQASVSNNRVRIDRFSYRLLAYARFGGDIYVSPKRGIRQYLAEPEALINPSFDIIFGGFRSQTGGAGGRPGIGSTPAPGGGNLFFDPSGGDRFNIIFTNLAGQTVKAPYVTLVSGSAVLGNGRQSLVVKEGSSSSNFNIDVGDYFVATSANDVNGVSNIVVYSGVSRSDNALIFDVLGQGRTQAHYDSATGKGSVNIGGFTFTIYVDLGSTDRIVVDQNHDGGFSGATARIVTQGGAQIEPGASSTTLRIARGLFDNPPSSDETTAINFIADGSRITAQIPSQTSVTLRHSNDRISRGMTPFGVQFTLDDRHSPAPLSVDIPRSQRSASVSVSRSQVGRVSKGAQAGALVVVTMERERFLQGSSQLRDSGSSRGVGVND